MSKPIDDPTNKRLYEAIRLRTIPDAGAIEAYSSRLHRFLDSGEWRGVYSPSGTQIHTFESGVFPGVSVAVLAMPKAKLVDLTGNAEASAVLDPNQPVPFVLCRSSLWRRDAWASASVATLEHETAHVLQGIRNGPLSSDVAESPEEAVKVMARWFREEFDANFIEAYHFPEPALRWVEADDLTEKLCLTGPSATNAVALRRVMIWRNHIHTLERAASGMNCGFDMQELPVGFMIAVLEAMVHELIDIPIDGEDLNWFVSLEHAAHISIAWEVTARARETRAFRSKMSRDVQRLIDFFADMP